MEVSTAHLSVTHIHALVKHALMLIKMNFVAAFRVKCAIKTQFLIFFFLKKKKYIFFKISLS
jgi:hypothetical protein